MHCFTFVFDLKIDDIFDRTKNEINLSQSPITTSHLDVFFEWNLSFIPRCDQSNAAVFRIRLIKWSKNFSKKFVTPLTRFNLITKTADRNNDKIFVGAKFGLLADKDNRIVNARRFYVPPVCNFSGETPEILKIYPENVLKIVCRIAISNADFWPVDLNYVEGRLHDELCDAASELFPKITDSSLDESLSDVTLMSSDNVEFECHRFVLSAKSSVFRKMFSANGFFQKSKNNFPFVEIADIDGETLKIVLEYMYTGNSTFVAKTPTDSVEYLLQRVLYSSEKYDLQQLKSYCEHFLKWFLNDANILQYFEIADKYNLKSLMADCRQLFAVYFHLFDENKLEIFYSSPTFGSIFDAVMKTDIRD